MIDNLIHIKPSAAYEMYVEARAAHTGKSAADIQAESTPEAVEDKLRALHQQYISREVSLIRAADLLGVSAAHLHNMWDVMGLALRNVHPRICQC